MTLSHARSLVSGRPGIFLSLPILENNVFNEFVGMLHDRSWAETGCLRSSARLLYMIVPRTAYQRQSQWRRCRDSAAHTKGTRSYPQKALCGGIPCPFLEPLARSWSHCVGIYRQKLTKPSKNDFSLRVRRALRGLAHSLLLLKPLTSTHPPAMPDSGTNRAPIPS